MANTTDYSKFLDGYSLLAIQDFVKNNFVSLNGVSIVDNTNNVQQYKGLLSRRKVYTGVIGLNNITGKTNTWANRSIYFITVRPLTWNANWRIRYHINIHLTNESQQYKGSSSGSVVEVGQLCRSTHYCSISGGQGIYRAYSSFNTIQNTSYRTCYYSMIHETTRAGYNAGRGHKIGISFTDSYLPTPVDDYSSGSKVSNTKYSRTIEVVIDEAINCEATLEDYIEVEADSVLVGTSYGDNPYISLESTYYTTSTGVDNNPGRWTYIANLYAQGLQETGDDNTIDRLQLSAAYLINGSKYDNNGTLTGMRCLSYALLGFDKDGNALVLSTYSAIRTTRTTDISVKGTRIYEAVGFDYTKGLVYQNSSGYAEPNANMDISPCKHQMAIDLRYSDNCIPSSSATTLGMLPRKPVYLRGVIGSDGLFYLRPLDVTYNGNTYQRCWTQDIPNTEDGYIYWFIGYPYYNGSYVNSQYQLDLFSSTQLMWYKDGKFREYVPLAVKALDSDKLNGQSASYYYPASNPNGYTSVTESTVSGWGFTKNAGTVTKVDNISPSSGNVSLSAVRYVSQSLTDDQKLQARTNIGAGTSNFLGYTAANKLNSDYIENNAGWTSNIGTVTQVKVGTTAYNPTDGVISLPTYPTVNNSTITIKQTGISDQTFTLNGSAVTINLVDTWRPLGTGASDACAGNDSRLSNARTPTSHSHGAVANGGSIADTYAVTSGVQGVVITNSSNYIRKVTDMASFRTIIGAGTYSKPSGGIPDSDLASTFLKTAVTQLGDRTGNITLAQLKSDLSLGSAAYTASTDYATSAHTHTYLYNDTSQGTTRNWSKVELLTAGNYGFTFSGVVQNQELVTQTYKFVKSNMTWDTDNDEFLTTMKAVSAYVSNNFSASGHTHDKLHKGSADLTFQDKVTASQNQAWDLKITREGTSSAGYFSLPRTGTAASPETIATREWVQNNLELTTSLSGSGWLYRVTFDADRVCVEYQSGDNDYSCYIDYPNQQNNNAQYYDVFATQSWAQKKLYFHYIKINCSGVTSSQTVDYNQLYILIIGTKSTAYTWSEFENHIMKSANPTSTYNDKIIKAFAAYNNSYGWIQGGWHITSIYYYGASGTSRKIWVEAMVSRSSDSYRYIAASTIYTFTSAQQTSKFTDTVIAVN